MPTRLESAHSRTRRRISQESQRLIRRAWVLAAGDEDLFAAEAVAVAAAARASVVAEVDAYLALHLTAQGIPTSARGLDPDGFRRPVDPDVQWRRPYVQMRVKLDRGMEFPQAARFGQQMASTMAATDVQFSARGAASGWAQADGRIAGYRRVLGPGKNCPLCVAASDQRYHVADLLPIHDNCGCTVSPLVGDTRTTGLSEGAYQESLAEQGVLVADHGELGPYLYDAGHGPPLLGAAA